MRATAASFRTWYGRATSRRCQQTDAENARQQVNEERRVHRAEQECGLPELAPDALARRAKYGGKERQPRRRQHNASGKGRSDREPRGSVCVDRLDVLLRGLVQVPLAAARGLPEKRRKGALVDCRRLAHFGMPHVLALAFK